MNTNDFNSVSDSISTTHSRSANLSDRNTVIGEFHAKCFDKDGNLKWEERFDNVVTVLGKKYLLDRLDTSMIAVGPYMGLITAGSYTDTATMSTVTANEAGVGLLTTFRVAPTPSAASGATGTITKAFSAASFTAAGAGLTVTGCFMVCGTGALTTRADTGGTLYSVGTFTSKTLAATDVLQVTYSTTLA